ncbi:hypothetical protein EDD16DRAFT_1648347 [Pisolithus croceorrhizus]|nr:hypothetical protein EDD16DRAFT_1648347 [Pisolithus croceorrhizus]
MKPEETEELSSRMKGVCAYEYYHSGQRFILVDTPGLNNGELLQGAAFRAMATWLKDIVSPADVRSVELLRDLCGDEAADRVRLVTTMWDVVNESEAIEVEDSLRTHWQSLVNAGACPERFDNTPERAWIIVEGLENTKKTLLLQEELNEGTRLEDTSAGRHLRPEEWAAQR